MDVSRCPVPVDTAVLHTLRSQLHTFRKSFSGQEFVDQLLRLGQDTESHRPNSPPPSHHSPSLNGHVFSSEDTAHIEYTSHYAKVVGQYLLNKQILLALPNLTGGRGTVIVESFPSQQSSATYSRVGEGDRTHLKCTNSSVASSPQVNFHRLGLTESRESNRPTPTSTGNTFAVSPHSLYKFVDTEDLESRAFYHSQILAATSCPQSGPGLKVNTVFETARLGMLFLVHDLLQQRARREKRAKQFLQTPGVETVAEQQKELHTNCNLIFKM